MFRHVGIVVKSMEKQLFFYKDLLGLEIYYDEIENGDFLDYIIDLKNTHAHIIKLGKNNKTIVELLSFKESLKSNSKRITEHGITHFAITCENSDKIYMLLLNNNVDIINKPKVSSNGKYKVFFCKDFEGNFIEIVEELN